MLGGLNWNSLVQGHGSERIVGVIGGQMTELWSGSTEFDHD